MSASIAHEINNPITLIGTSSKIILRDLEKLDNEVLIKDNIVKNIERINKSVNRVGRIVKGLRTFSNQADNQPKEIISLKEIIEETCFFCSELLISKHVSLNIDEIPEIAIECHSVQISQVLINLIKNAAEVLVEDPCLDERWIKISFEHSKSLLKIIIINGGKKINPQIVSKLFGPFFTTKAVGVGTGLGLSISKNIMNDHNGDLEVDLNYDHTAFLMSFNL
jgi:C4-dicarboxylate-specific signal transduction histidine kinase